MDEDIDIAGEDALLRMWGEVKESLCYKGLLLEELDGYADIDKWLLETIYDCARAEVYCSYTFSRHPQKKYIGFYFAQGGAVMIEKSPKEEQTYILVSYNRFTQVIEEVRDYFIVSGYPAPEEELIYILSGDEVERIKSGSYKANDEAFEDLAAAIRSEDSLAAMICNKTDTEEKELCMSLLGNNYIWSMADEKGNTRFEAVGGEQWLQLMEEAAAPLKRYFEGGFMD